MMQPTGRLFSASLHRLVLLAFGLASLPGAALAESWTDLRGTRTIEARMVGMWGDSVVLELLDGRRISVEMRNLRSESRIQAQDLKRELDANRKVRVDELQGQAVAASSPAPDPLPTPPEPPAYQPPQPGVPIEQFLGQIDSAIADGHLIAMYDALPPKYRQDLGEVFSMSVAKMDPANFQTLTGTLQQLGDLIVTRQRWFMSSPRFKAMPEAQAAEVEGQLLAVAGLMRTGLDPEWMSIEKLRQTSLEQFMKQLDQKTAPQVAQLFRYRDPSSTRQVTVDSQREAIATVTVSQQGARQRVAYVQFDGYWVPKKMADEWDKNIADQKESLSGASSGMMLSAASLLLSPLASTLSPMAQAENEIQFHSAMESMFNTVQPMVAVASMAVGQKLASIGGGASAGGGYQGGGYEDGYGGMDEGYGEPGMDQGYGEPGMGQDYGEPGMDQDYGEPGMRQMEMSGER